ncbi:MAG: hypothetical protein NTW19_07480 [Planctomycetota bacterium]|nr:hypothetical protein [Planctomycetota bacterium]
MTSDWQPLGLSGGGGMFTPAISPLDPGLVLITCDMSGSYRSEDGGQTWSLLPWDQLTGCPFCGPAFHPKDPDVVFAAYSYAATLRVSRDRGQTWSPIGRSLPGDLRAIAIDPQRPERMIVGAKLGLFRSVDGGETWSRVLETAADDEPTHVVFDRANATADRRIVFMASRTSIRRSEDGGATWRAITPPRESAARIVSFATAFDAVANRLTAYAWGYPQAALDGKAPVAAITHVLRSDDLGRSWTSASTIDVPAGWAVGGHHFLLACDKAPDRLYAVLPLNLPRGTVQRSDDRGRTWRSIATSDKTAADFNLPVNYCTAYFLPRSIVGWAICNAFIDPSNPDRLVYSHYCHVHETRDGGATWRGLDTRAEPGHPPMGEHTLLPRFEWANTGLVVTTTWNYYVDPFDRDRHTIAYTDLGMAQSTNRGRTWAWRRETGANTYEMAWDPEVKGRVWAAFSSVHDIPNNNIVLGGHWHGSGTGCVGYSEDHGRTWSGRNGGLPGGDDASRAYDWSIPTMGDFPVTSVILDPRSPRERRRLFASLFERGVFRSDDGGFSWRDASRGLGCDTNPRNRRACRLKIHADGSLFCVVTGNLVDGKLSRAGVGLYRSDDAGESWRALTDNLDIRWACDFDVDPRDSGVIYLGVCDDTLANREDGGLFKTTDGGKTWRLSARKSSRHFGATVDPAEPDVVYMTLNYNDGKVPALWVSRDAGGSWSPVEGFPFCSAHRVAFDPFDEGVIYVTTYGASAWRGPRARGLRGRGKGSRP